MYLSGCVVTVYRGLYVSLAVELCLFGDGGGVILFKRCFMRFLVREKVWIALMVYYMVGYSVIELSV